MEKLLLIDGHSILNRAFFGMPPLTTREGVHTNAVIGFLNIMTHLLDVEKPGYLAVAFDLSAPTFRRYHHIIKVNPCRLRIWTSPCFPTIS